MTWVGARPQHGPQDSTGAGYLARLKVLRALGVEYYSFSSPTQRIAVE